MNGFPMCPSALVDRVSIAADAVVGPDCLLKGDISIGPRVQLGAGVALAGNVVLGERCRIDAGVATTGDLHAPLIIGAGALVGARSVLSLGIRVGTGAQVEAGSIVTKNVPAYAIVKGNPASVVDFVTTEPPPTFNDVDGVSVVHSRCVAGVKLYRFPEICDPRGYLTFGEFGEKCIPFIPRRYFMVYGVPPSELRGEHAHVTSEEILFCTAGSVAVVVDDGTSREEYILDSPKIGLFMPSMIWGTQYKHSPDAMLLVIASSRYDHSDYIVDYDKFLAARKAVNAA